MEWNKKKVIFNKKEIALAMWIYASFSYLTYYEGICLYPTLEIFNNITNTIIFTPICTICWLMQWSDHFKPLFGIPSTRDYKSHTKDPRTSTNGAKLLFSLLSTPLLLILSLIIQCQSLSNETTIINCRSKTLNPIK